MATWCTVICRDRSEKGTNLQAVTANSRTIGRTAWVSTATLILVLCNAKCFSEATHAAAPDTAAPAATVQALCDVLLESMKKGSAMDIAGRVKLLDAPLRRLYDLPLLTRLVVGPPWRGLDASDQQALVAAFSDYSVAVYASRFKGYSGERFVVDPAADKLAGGDSVVHTKLLPGSGEPVQLDYVLRSEPSGWHIIDVLLNGTISEMAERRSEYSSTLRDGGATALVKLLQQKTEELRK
ncbi:MAG: ABC transporter substrate-binding protein [Steroidobacteraceae bacterium]